jgi:hypothetical protein
VHRIVVWVAPLLAAWVVFGCAADGAPGSPFTGDGGSPPDSARSDAGALPRYDADVSDRCTTVDLLFVIDNSPSMRPYQESLAAAFPGFVDAMYERLPSGTNLHVGITTTSFFDGSCSESVVNCVSTASDAEIDAHYTRPSEGSTGVNGEQGRLFEHRGLRFFEANTSDVDRAPLKSWFAEAATEAGESGCSFELPTAAASFAFDPANASSNGGFLRDDDTPLLIFVLSDEPDKTPGALEEHLARIAAAKSACGGAECVVTAGLVNTCIERVDNVLWRFLHSFPTAPILGDIDEQDRYLEVVGDALAEIVEQRCNEVILI